MAIAVAYVISIILTYTNVFPDDKSHAFYRARTDARLSVLSNAKWFRVPYPGRYSSYIGKVCSSTHGPFTCESMDANLR